jgi:hypothetical protein
MHLLDVLNNLLTHFFFPSLTFLKISDSMSFLASSFLTDLSETNLAFGCSRCPATMAVAFGWTTTVALNWATNSPFFSWRTTNSCKRSCSTHSLTPTFAPVVSAKPAIENGKVAYLLLTSKKNSLAF